MENCYETIVIGSLLKSIREILLMLSCDKLSDYCFYITFCSSTAGVIFPGNVTKDNDDMVTIVLQNQFWNLKVEQNGFYVTLNFFGKKHDIYVPYESICLFSDPMKDFLLDFRNFYSKINVHDQNQEKDGIIFLDFSNNN